MSRQPPLFGDDGEQTLRDEIEEAIDEAEDSHPVAGDLSSAERQMLRNLLHFGERTAADVAVTRGDIIAVPSTISFDELIAAIQKLAEHAKMGKPIPWVKIYKVPEYVWFSHQAHHKGAGLECETCHGPVAEREVIVKERPTSMQSCMACHAKRGASNDCGFCHNPN